MSAWILHVSDPHLGDISPGQGHDDEKVKFRYQRDLETTQRVFKRTLALLDRFVAEHGKPAAMVVSGDLTYMASQKGFDQFAELLNEHKDVLPPSERIVVVPGNHDVVWDEKPGDPARYESFLAATRTNGCATPLLDGVDFAADDETGKLFPGVSAEPHLARTDDVLIVALNTSNYCGELVDIRGGWTEEEWTTALGRLPKGGDKALAQLKRLRQHDMARVSRAQLEALTRLFDELGEPRERRASDERVRIAVMHHQLLPVSEREERKPFESLVNLGQVRSTLAQYGFDVVLHGHKHESSLYWDLPSTQSEDLGAPVRRMLVIASPGHFKAGDPTMRALFLKGNARARNLDVRTFLGASSERKLKEAPSQLVGLWEGAMEAETAERVMIRGASAHATYARIRSSFALQRQDPVGNLVCQVNDPGDALSLPPDYPLSGFDDPQRWFTELVEWWQRPRSELVARGLVEFNHGERVRTRWGDQVARAAHQLNSRDNSSRALICLIHPRETGRRKPDPRRLEEGGTYPAFALAGFSVRVRSGRRHLDCFAWFRKQEMQYWWPVNLAELAMLQESVRSGLHRAAQPGRIVTFSAIALWKDALPRVAVPEADRLIEQPDRLWRLASSLAFPSTATEEARSDWRTLLADLEGTARDEPPRPRTGIGALRGELARFANLPESESLDATVAALDELLAQYGAFKDQTTLNDEAAALLHQRSETLRIAVQARLGANDG